MRLLEGAIRPYAWGSRTALAALRGAPTPTIHPEAELWFGAHPGDPATVVEGETRSSLADAINDDQVAALGADCHRRFGQLPFLVKVLAANEPLSLQAHPSSAQAQAGFAAENQAGIPLDAPNRNYRDPNHKPELVVALTEFDALAGFRDPAATVELLRELQVSELDSYLGMLAGQPDSLGLRAVVTTWITLPESALAKLIPALLTGCVRYLASGQKRFADVAKTVVELGEMYPRDPGVLTVLLLNRVTLAPGEGLFLAAGNLHAYLRGTAVEIMANSDNVLRGGLTPKHVDVPELLRVLDFEPIAESDLQPTIRALNAETIYETSMDEFRLSRVELDGTGLRHAVSIAFDMPGPQILLCVSGSIELRSAGGTMTVPSGYAAWLSDDDPDVTVHAASSRAVFFRALVPVT